MAKTESIPPQNLPADYSQARSQFLQACNNAGAELRSVVHPLSGPDGEIAMDVASLGQKDARNAVLIVSGTHGVEGYAGSPLQTQWLLNHAGEQPTDLRTIWVHAHNPFGFAWTRRVNEDNIDLNRNYLNWPTTPQHNEGYDTLAEHLVPAEWTEDVQQKTTETLLGYAVEYGMEKFQAAVSQGQYAYPTGLFYGGSGPTWSYQQMHNLVNQELAGLERLAVIDLHTGLGEWGYGELISHHPMNSDGYRRADKWWSGVRSMVDGDSVSAHLTGDWLERLDDWMGEVEVTSCALEFGTVDTVTVLQSLRADAWMYAHGDPNGPNSDNVRKQVRCAFADDDPRWIATLWPRFVEVLEASMQQLSATNSA